MQHIHNGEHLPDTMGMENQTPTYTKQRQTFASGWIRYERYKKKPSIQSEHMCARLLRNIEEQSVLLTIGSNIIIHSVSLATRRQHKRVCYVWHVYKSKGIFHLYGWQSRWKVQYFVQYATAPIEWLWNGCPNRIIKFNGYFGTQIWLTSSEFARFVRAVHAKFTYSRCVRFSLSP